MVKLSLPSRTFVLVPSSTRTSWQLAALYNPRQQLCNVRKIGRMQPCDTARCCVWFTDVETEKFPEILCSQSHAGSVRLRLLIYHLLYAKLVMFSSSCLPPFLPINKSSPEASFYSVFWIAMGVVSPTGL